MPQKISKCQRCSFTTGKGAGALAKHYSQSNSCQRSLAGLGDSSRIIELINGRRRRRSESEEPPSEGAPQVAHPANSATNDDHDPPAENGDVNVAHRDKRRRTGVTVEEVADEGDPYIYRDPTAGVVYEEGCETRWETRLRTDEEAGLPPWAPFADEEEMELAHRVWESGASQKSMDKYFKLKIVSETRLGRVLSSIRAHQTFLLLL